jgi:hypothetical protein
MMLTAPTRTLCSALLSSFFDFDWWHVGVPLGEREDLAHRHVGLEFFEELLRRHFARYSTAEPQDSVVNVTFSDFALACVAAGAA